MDQKNITIKNIKMLQSISNKYDGILAEQADALLQLAKVHPRKKKRCGFLYYNHRQLFENLVSLGFLEDYSTPSIETEGEYLSSIEMEKESLKDNEKIDANLNFNDQELPF